MTEGHDRDWLHDGLETLDACPVCNGEARKLLYDRLTDIIFKNAPGEWTMWQCSACGSAYLDPRPSQDTIHIAYKSYYTHGGFAGPNAEENLRSGSSLKKILRTLANGYRNGKYGTRYKDSHWLGYRILSNLPSSRELIDVQFRYLPKTDETETARLVDVGCGDGSFLELAKGAGWNVVGCDPDPDAVERVIARGLNVRVSELIAARPEIKSPKLKAFLASLETESKALAARQALVHSEAVLRRVLAVTMLARGQYRYFNGLRSFLRDVAR